MKRQPKRRRLSPRRIAAVICCTALAGASILSVRAAETTAPAITATLADADTISVTGSGFRENSTVRLSYAFGAAIAEEATTADSKGSFTATKDAPPGYVGIVTITARGKGAAPSITTPAIEQNPTSAPSTTTATPKPETSAATTSLPATELVDSTPPAASGSVAQATTAVSIAASDIVGCHDAIPRGVPEGYDWRECAQPITPLASHKGFQAMNTWGQVFASNEGGGNFAVRLEVRNPAIQFHSSKGWTTATIPSGSAGSLGGAYWRGDFGPSNSSDAQIAAGSTPGSYSVSLAPLQNGPDVFHYWWDGMNPRIAIPADADGVMISHEMRLVPEGSGSVADASFIGNSCGDLYPTANTTIDPSGINPGINQARMKRVTGEWQTFYASTMTPDELRANPF